MAINFPNSPSVNDTFSVGNTLYEWDGTAWRRAQDRPIVTTGTSSPSNPVDGELWFNETDESLELYYDDGVTPAWVPAVKPEFEVIYDDSPAAATATELLFSVTAGEFDELVVEWDHLYADTSSNRIFTARAHTSNGFSNFSLSSSANWSTGDDARRFSGWYKLSGLKSGQWINYSAQTFRGGTDSANNFSRSTALFTPSFVVSSAGILAGDINQVGFSITDSSSITTIAESYVRIVGRRLYRP